MRYLLNPSDWRYDQATWRQQWSAYDEYLRSLRGRIPESAFDFATAEWHYNFSDPRCPHDATVEEFTLLTRYSGSRWYYRGRSGRTSRLGRSRLHKGYLPKREQVPHLDIFVRLLGAYRDGYMELTYKKVCSFDVSSPRYRRGYYPIGPGDWHYDEVRLSDQGLVEHEIQFGAAVHSKAVYWKIECEDIFFEWKPAASAG
ncbi:MAG TPA: hypothetical protein VF914_07625 [Chloroflexia bacterium]|jgi:hypothetical protein